MFAKRSRPSGWQTGSLAWEGLTISFGDVVKPKQKPRAE